MEGKQTKKHQMKIQNTNIKNTLKAKTTTKKNTVILFFPPTLAYTAHNLGRVLVLSDFLPRS